MEIEEPECVEEYEEWGLEFNTLAKGSKTDKSTNNTVFGGEGLRKVEKARRERAQTANVIQAINVGMEVSLLYYISVLIVLEVVA